MERREDRQASNTFSSAIRNVKSTCPKYKKSSCTNFTIYSYCIIRTGVVLAAGLPGQRGEGGQAGLEGIVRRQSQLQKG